MLKFSILNISIILSLLLDYYEIINSNPWVNLYCEIIIISLVILIAGRSTDKILKGLQGTASATVIARGAIDAYKAWESNNDDEDNSKENNNKNDIKKEEAKNEDNKDEVNNNKTNEK
uniref:Uncharacterized protein n=1 Tax=Russula virescens TaxID=71688 RepID=A0A2S0U417_9AGAM|nr:hypothetical protein [Russula virescens]AWB36226.1 hypothetical protein [Russula virescens]